MAGLIGSRISRGWLRDLERLRDLEPYADDEEFSAAFAAVKRENKARLAGLIRDRLGMTINPTSLFDLHIKRIHEYKRQLLNALSVIARYNRIRAGVHAGPPRTVIFAGKAAPGYVMAKRIIQLINHVADTVNNDPATQNMLKVVFVPNYDVQTAEDLIPAGDLSQQISTAGTEASGTGNMKLALNGALTIASYDGANGEIAEAVGKDNIFMFGHDYEALRKLRDESYDPAAIYESHAELKQALDMVRGGYFSPGQADLFVPIFDSLVRQGDHYMVLADYDSYLKCQENADKVFLDQKEWVRKAVLNVARFSIDRLVKEYAAQVWDATPVPLQNGPGPDA